MSPQTELAIRLYARMLTCPCEFARNCVQCQLDMEAIKAVGEFENLTKIDPEFLTDMDKVKGTKR